MASRFTVGPSESTLLPMVHSIEDDCSTTGCKSVTSTLVRDYTRHPGAGLVLQNPIALSLRDNEHISYLIKVLSSRLAGKCLVTTVVQCSACCTPDDFRQQDRTMGHPIYSPCPPPGSASEPCDSLAKPRVITPLYNLSTPLIWREDVADGGTRSRFDKIR